MLLDAIFFPANPLKFFNFLLQGEAWFGGENKKPIFFLVLTITPALEDL